MKFWTLFAVVVLTVCGCAKWTNAGSDDLIYGYECQSSRCVKVELDQQNFDKAVSLPVCRLFCGGENTIGTLWPKPTGAVQVEPYMVHIDYKNIEFYIPANKDHRKLWEVNKVRFFSQLSNMVYNHEVVKPGGYHLKIEIDIADLEQGKPRLTLDADESYTLSTESFNNGTVAARIVANSFFGGRHGLETLAQLIVYDDIRREIQMVAKVNIQDAPAYKWRGVLLDTARNYYSVKSIKRTIDALAMVKLNTFHWHMTDTHSFPFEVKSQPELYKLGAYSPRKIYTHAAIAEIVEYGRERGVRVMPEFDAPAHVGEGWQHKNMTACWNIQPWWKYCVEPPCGQLDPTVPEMYSVLEDIYREMFELFNPDVFHMGGDEVSVDCWNTSTRIQEWMLRKKWNLNEDDFIRLWGQFQDKALERVDKVASAKNTPVILWTSRLTDAKFIDDYLDKERYIIQIWTTGNDPVIKEILKRGYRVIVSNYDALYLDCGGPGWVGAGNNWCSPFKGWQTVYDNSPEEMVGNYNSLVLGAEAVIWSEQIDDFTLDSRFWPRASALAERLWSNPTDPWRKAEARMLIHRERLVDNGIGAERLQPEWCLQNEDNCPQDV